MSAPGDSGGNDDQKLAQFQDITGANLEQAKFFLESAQGNLDLAVASFFEGGAEGEAERQSAGEPMEEGSGGAAAAAGSGGGSSSGKAPPARRIPEDSSSDDDDEDGQAFYAGGSTSSGQQILGPPKNKKKSNHDLVKEMFRKAKEAGAESVDPSTGSSAPSSSRRAFTGTAFRLGSDSTTSERVGGADDGQARAPREFKLKMWSNGFSLDDGELRDYNDPEQQAFLRDVQRGRIPLELIKQAKSGEVHVDMEDHRNEEYVKPKVSEKPFQGVGHTLGGITPSVSSGAGAGAAASASAAASPADNAANEKSAKEKYPVDESQPTTTLQIRFPDGSRLIVKLNQTNTIGQLRQYLTLARPQYANTEFALSNSYPPKQLEKDEDTLKDAGVLNAAIMLRPK